MLPGAITFRVASESRSLRLLERANGITFRAFSGTKLKPTLNRPGNPPYFPGLPGRLALGIFSERTSRNRGRQPDRSNTSNAGDGEKQEGHALMRVLVVENERRLGENIAAMLREQSSYAVDLSRDGEDGRQMAMTNPYDLVVLDRLYDFGSESFSNVVEVHISMLRRKLDPGPTYKLIHTVRGQGYVLGERPR
jgi:hypothetical protein